MSVDAVDDLLAMRKSPALAAGLDDEDLALALFAEEAEGLLNFTKDHLANGSVGEELFEELIEMEEIAHYDHLMAVALSQGKEPPPRPPPRLRGNR